MNSSEWLLRLWHAQLAACMAMLAVGLLRRSCRRWFGAEPAFLLWLLAPLAMVASQWPHPAHGEWFVLPEAMQHVAAAPASIAAAGAGMRVDAAAAALCVWLLGSMALLIVAWRAQRAYEAHLEGAAPYATSAARWPVVRAASLSVGPAMVGAWRPVIVLPADFEQRYAPEERALVLAHEIAHAERRDGLWALAATVFAAVCWPVVLAWWAQRAFRQDQELACDARVLRRCGGRRRSYAQAMLKTTATALALPSGCSWSSTHPLTERIAMLKISLPGPLARRTGLVAMLAAGVAVSGLVYAATTPVAPAISADAASEYQLDLTVDVSSDQGGQRHARKASAALCLKPGKQGSIRVPDWALDATVMPDAANHVRVALQLKDASGASLADSSLQGGLGELLHERGTARDGSRQYAIDVTPRAGCPARERVARAG